MLRRNFIPLLLLSFLLLTLNSRIALAYGQSDSGPHGFFMGAGVNVMKAVNKFKGFGGGTALPSFLGYRLNDRWEAQLQSDFIFFRKSSINYVMIPVVPTVKYNFWHGAFGYAGFGYSFLYAGRGSTIGGTATTKSTKNHGYTIHYGLGWDFPIHDRATFSPKFGMDYTKIAGGNLMTAGARFNIQYYF